MRDDEGDVRNWRDTACGVRTALYLHIIFHQHFSLVKLADASTPMTSAL